MDKKNLIRNISRLSDEIVKLMDELEQTKIQAKEREQELLIEIERLKRQYNVG